ncbi:putative Plant invertase/pectin methylesterase inhibitor superfamily protein [Hibiscus syriacus]|uniref:Plant invertase/pectin methylesterase inhibitor superfamily protein n=1 Tax=Hibiscus syriacus TaxID=106335 RepID=A0A6A3A3C6_HIBSY|nr:21 kDa protein-like [Hibiscus syriacus]KAE8698147.1 putative Plant invertase/pectin methylesterase inhibitor superfamily protein [Hibiscus syriacus]
MARKFSIYALIFLVIILQLSSYFNPCSASNGSHKEFIRNSCRATSYPKLCLKSLARHASKIRGDPKLLAHTALNATFFAAKSTSRLLRDMSRIHRLKTNEEAAMTDCVADISDSMQKLRMSIEEMDREGDRVRAGGSDVLRVQMNDIQMWVNTALEEEETCMNALANIKIKAKMKNGVRRRIVKVAHLTSNALTLVKSFALAPRNEKLPLKPLFSSRKYIEEGLLPY